MIWVGWLFTFIVVGILLHQGLALVFEMIGKLHQYWVRIPDRTRGSIELLVLMVITLWIGNLYLSKALLNFRVADIGLAKIFAWISAVIGFITIALSKTQLEKVVLPQKITLKMEKLSNAIRIKTLRFILSFLNFISNITRTVSYFLIPIIILLGLLFIGVSLGALKFYNIKLLPLIKIGLIYSVLFGFLVIGSLCFCWLYRRLFLLCFAGYNRNIFFVVIAVFLMTPMIVTLANIATNILLSYLKDFQADIPFPVLSRILKVLVTVSVVPTIIVVIFHIFHVWLTSIFKTSRFAGDMLSRTGTILSISALALLIFDTWIR